MLPDKGTWCANFSAACIGTRTNNSAKGKLKQRLSKKNRRFDVRYGKNDGNLEVCKRRGLPATRTDRLC